MSSDISHGIIEVLRKRIANLEMEIALLVSSENALEIENFRLKIEKARLECLLYGRKPGAK